MKRPLVTVEFDTELDEMTDEEIDVLAGEIAEAMAAQLEALPDSSTSQQAKRPK